MLRSFLARRQLHRWIGATEHCGAVVVFSTHASTAAEQGIVTRIPPNLSFDPRSSFAPRPLGKVRSPVPPPASLDEDAKEDNQGASKEVLHEEEEHKDLSKDEDTSNTERFIPSPEVIIYAKPLPERLNVEVHTLFAPEHSTLTGTLHLDASVFGNDPIRVDLLKRAVNYYRARKRGRRTAKTKTIAEVSGSGRKVRQQKGTGKARAGHSRPPHWRGGAKAHGPKNVTDYGKTKLNRKVRQAATRHVLSQKLKENNLLVLSQLHELSTHKTGQLVRLLEPWGLGGQDGTSALILDHYYPGQDESTMPDAFDGVPANAHVASRNIPRLNVANCSAANVWEILKYEKLVLTLAAVKHLEQRLAIEI